MRKVGNVVYVVSLVPDNSVTLNLRGNDSVKVRNIQLQLVHIHTLPKYQKFNILNIFILVTTQSILLARKEKRKKKKRNRSKIISIIIIIIIMYSEVEL